MTCLSTPYPVCSPVYHDYTSNMTVILGRVCQRLGGARRGWKELGR